MGLFGFLKNKNKDNDNTSESMNPKGKPLEWFLSDAGLEALKEYTSPQNYMLEETYKKEYEELGKNCGLSFYCEVFHKEAKIPTLFFKYFIDNIHVEALEYAVPRNILIDMLKMQAETFSINDDGEPEETPAVLEGKDLLSFESNPVLNYISNFDCFKLGDDADGSWGDKFRLWSAVVFFLVCLSEADKEGLSKNSWIFDKSVYFNDFGTVRKLKGFYKKCIEKSSMPDYFKQCLDKLEKGK